MERPLGHYERYSLSRTLVGMPPALAFVATLPTAPQRSDVVQAIAVLLRRYPLLSCVVTDTRTTSPKFVAREFSAEEVVKVDATRGDGGGTTEEALLAGLGEAKRIDVEEGPLWRVLYEPSSESARIVLAANHTVSDGAGCKALLAELVLLIYHPEEIRIDTAGPTMALTMESSVDVRPPVLLLLREVFLELVAPRLPAFLQPTPSLPIYPSPALVTPHNQPTALRLAMFPSTIVAALKAAGAAHGVATIQPILHTCVIAALVTSSSALPGPHNFIIGTAISLRDPSLHPPATGNYVAALMTSTTSSPLSSDFWTLTRAYAKRLADPKERAWAKGTMGMLAYIPDGIEEGGTRWEAFLRKKMAAENPWMDSAGLSNLGAVRMPLDGVDVAWAQAAPAVGCFSLNVRKSPLYRVRVEER